MTCIGFLLKIPLNQRFHNFFGDFASFLHTFFICFFHHIIHLRKRYKNIYDLHRFSIGNPSISAISHLFFTITPSFHTFFKLFFHHIIRLLKCYKNIYDSHRFYIENSSELAISHLFFAISHLFIHTFFEILFTLHFSSVKRQKKNRSIPITVLRFCPVTRFATTHT